MIRKLADEHVLSGAAFVIPTLGFLAPLGVAPLLTAVAIGLIVIAPRRRLQLARSCLPLAVLLALLAVWGAISAIWSIIPGHSLFEAARLLLLSASGLIVVTAALALRPPGTAMVGRAGLAGIVLGLAIALVEVVGNFPIHRALSGNADRIYFIAVLDRGAVIMALACWVPILSLIEQRRLAAAACIFLAALVALFELHSLSATLGLIVAAVIFTLAWWRPRATKALVLSGLTAATLAVPFLVPTRNAIVWLSTTAPGLRLSAFHRLIIWRFTSDRIQEHPFLGWGMDASRAMPGGKEDVNKYLRLPPDFLSGRLSGEVMPLHPHDAILQWWVELGVIGAMLGLAILTWTTWRAGSFEAPSRAARAVSLTVICAALPAFVFDFGVWQAWWQSTLWLVAAFVIAGTRSPP